MFKGCWLWFFNSTSAHEALCIIIFLFQWKFLSLPVIIPKNAQADSTELTLFHDECSVPRCISIPHGETDTQKEIIREDIGKDQLYQPIHAK